jgi:AcrR family transcriptional regulator
MGTERSRAKLGRPARVPGEKHTKEKIFDAAVDLFAEHGYDATSVRQIGAAVGLTESAVYRHFAGKKAILDAVFAYVESRIYAPLPIGGNQGEKEGDSIFRSLLMPVPRIIETNPLVVKIVRIMYAEMHHNAEIRRYYREEYVEKADELMEGIFKESIEKGLIRACDPRALARVFNAFRAEWAFQSFIMDHEAPPDVGALQRDLEAPIRLFEDLLVPGKDVP